MSCLLSIFWPHSICLKIFYFRIERIKTIQDPKFAADNPYPDNTWGRESFVYLECSLPIFLFLPISHFGCRLQRLTSTQLNVFIYFKTTNSLYSLLALPTNIVFSHLLKCLDHKYQGTTEEIQEETFFREKKYSKERLLHFFKKMPVMVPWFWNV